MTDQTKKSWEITADAITCDSIRAFADMHKTDLNLIFYSDEQNPETLKASTGQTSLLFDLPLKIGYLFDKITKKEEKEKNLADNKILEHARFSLNRMHGLLNLKTDDTQEQNIKLTEKETEILSYLLKNKGKNIPRKELLAAIWKYADTVETHTLETHMYRLRQKMEKNPSLPEIIITTENGYTLKDGKP